jgi:crotonobetainyl-CoA:carnitine CoA-transferase CaiB-like acyl-CoA transferase
VDRVTESSPLGGVRVLDLSTTLPGALATQFLADAGADVLMVEAPGGSPVRRYPAWPSLGRGKRSTVADLRTDEGRARLHALVPDADVLLWTGRPGHEASVGLDGLKELNPALVTVAITGFGPTGPLAGIKGYEGVVMAKLGFCHAKALMAPRPGPAFVSVPFASWGAAMAAVQGVLAALLERERSGKGQHVDADLARGAHSIDTWAWYTDLVGLRWPDAYQVTAPFTEHFQPLAPLIYALLVAPTRDGHWMQFASVQPRLFAAMMEEFGLAGVFSDPKWAGLPVLPTQALRTELWEMLIAKVGERTLAEWEQVFERNPNLFAESFRPGARALEHPQLLHDQRVVTIDDPEVGEVRQPATLALADGRHTTELCPAPRLGDGGAEVTAARGVRAKGTAPAMPLEGITILDFGVMFAGPFGATLLTDLGARVVKIESLDGDEIRRIQSFPESGGAKVMQGKESLCVDLGSDDGRRIIHDLVPHVDVVLQSFRAGAAARAGIDEATLRALNPELVYVNAPGYGTGGPYGAKPAYAPSIAAATGLALIEAPGVLAATGSLAELKRASLQLTQATAVPALQPDGLSALGVAATILLGLLARARGHRIGQLTTSMLSTTVMALQNDLLEYDGKPASPRVDDALTGWGALYRLYPAGSGWVFLAVVTDEEWSDLVDALDVPQLREPRFATAAARQEHDAELAEVLSDVIAGRAAAEWEKLLLSVDVACVEAPEVQPHRLIQEDPALAAEYAATCTSPVFDEHLRPGPLVRFSRSRTQSKGFHQAGDDTDAILQDLGYDDARIADLHERNVVR